MRTRLRICRNKLRYTERDAAMAAAARLDWTQRAYVCDRCFGWHLTTRLKGKRRPRPGA